MELLGHRMPGMTGHYSHGGAQWDSRLREAVTLLEKSLLSKKADDKSADENAYEAQLEVVGLRKLLISGEPRAARTHDPRLKRAMLYQLS